MERQFGRESLGLLVLCKEDADEVGSDDDLGLSAASRLAMLACCATLSTRRRSGPPVMMVAKRQLGELVILPRGDCKVISPKPPLCLLNSKAGGVHIHPRMGGASNSACLATRWRLSAAVSRLKQGYQQQQARAMGIPMAIPKKKPRRILSDAWPAWASCRSWEKGLAMSPAFGVGVGKAVVEEEVESTVVMVKIYENSIPVILT